MVPVTLVQVTNWHIVWPVFMSMPHTVLLLAFVANTHLSIRLCSHFVQCVCLLDMRIKSHDIYTRCIRKAALSNTIEKRVCQWAICIPWGQSFGLFLNSVLKTSAGIYANLDAGGKEFQRII